MRSKEEILRRIKNANSWRETLLAPKEVYNAFTSDSSAVSSEDVKVLKEKVKRLESANKQLREENKTLKGAKK